VRQNTGREEDPVGVLRANGNWYVYFIDNQMRRTQFDQLSLIGKNHG